MRLPVLRHLMLLSFAALLGACHGKDESAQPGGSSPVAAVQTSVDLFKAGDFNRLWKHALPPADYANLRIDWKRQQDRRPITPLDRARFDQALQQLTGPDAENKLYAELQPKLAAMERQYEDQLPVLLTVGGALAKKAVAENKELTPSQKGQLTDALDAITPWAQQAPWFDPARAKRAIGVAVTTARQLNLKSPEQMRAMDFDAVMSKYSIAYGGLKQLLAIYGLSLDDTLNSVRLSEISNHDGHAVVKIDYILLGKPLSTETNLVNEHGRWYSEDMLQNVRKSHQQLNQTTMAQASAPAAAASVAGTD
ncbi:MAG TPA: hypothetical protein VGN24_05100 [Rhodanobacter sp.]|nr:hypothetical protein [Rhodanobacter sp.]